MSLFFVCVFMLLLEKLGIIISYSSKGWAIFFLASVIEYMIRYGWNGVIKINERTSDSNEWHN